MISRRIPFRPILRPTSIALKHLRLTSTESRPTSIISSKKEAQSLLTAQRLRRPVSPHLTIYRPQITSVGSITHRITGLILSGSFYIFGISYLIAPYLGWDFNTVVAAFAAWPLAVQAGVKTLVAWPFVYHCVNGLRHLYWDMGRGLTNRAVAVSGWVGVGVSVVTALYLGLLY